jgi:hypothetical protein
MAGPAPSWHREKSFMTGIIIAVYDTHDHAEQAIAALLDAGVPAASIHRHIRDGDDLTGERPSIVEVEHAGLLATLFGDGDPVEHVVLSDSPEAGGTVVRVTMIPPDRHEAVLDIMERFHPSDVQSPPNP